MSAQDVLVLAEIQRDTLADITLELLAAARGLTAATGGQVICVVLSQDGSRFAPRTMASRMSRSSSRRAWYLASCANSVG